MQKSYLLTILFYLCFGYALAQRADSLSKVALVYASQNNVEALRPLFNSIKTKMPHHVYLFADMTLARNDGHYARVIECIDSLYKWYPKQINKKSWLSLAEIKAEALRNMGKYREMVKHCDQEIKYLKRYGFTKTSLKGLHLLKEKAIELEGENDIRKLLQLKDQNLFFELDSLYNRIKDNDVDELTRLRCEFILARTFHRNEIQNEAALQLVKKHCVNLGTKELTEYIELYAEQLIKDGKWKELADWTQQVSQKNISHFAPIETYKRWADAFNTHPCSSLTTPKTPYVLPTTYEWPVLLDASINQGTNFSCCISMEQPYTLISDSIANINKIDILDDTLNIITNNGMLEVSPAVINELNLGEITYHHIFTYVVHHSNPITAPFNCAIGLNQLMDLGKITFYPEHLYIDTVSVHNIRLNTLQAPPNLYLSAQRGLQLFAKGPQKSHPLSIDLSYPNNLLHKEEWKQQDASEPPIITIGKDTLNINGPQYVDYCTPSHDGVLGVPFLRHYHSVCFDFNLMQLSVGKELEYQPVRGIFNYNTDIHYLERNAQSLIVGPKSDFEEQLFLRQVIASAKNDPQEVCHIIQELHDRRSAFYNATTEAEALFQTNHIQEAITLIRQTLEKKGNTILSVHEREKLQIMLEYFQLYSNEKVPKIQKHHSGFVCFDLNQNPYPKVKIHRKKAQANFNPFYPYTEVSDRQVRRFRIKRLGKTNGTEYGIIPQISCGHLTFFNVPCRILTDPIQISQRIPNDGTGILVGWDFLRLLHQMTFSKDQLTLSTETLVDTETGANVYYTNQWHIEVQINGDYHTLTCIPHISPTSHMQPLLIGDFSISLPVKYSYRSPQSATEYIQWSDILSKTESITMDFKEMKWTLK